VRALDEVASLYPVRTSWQSIDGELVTIYQRPTVAPETFRLSSAVCLCVFGAVGTLGAFLPWWGASTPLNPGIGATPAFHSYGCGLWKIPLAIGFLTLLVVGLQCFIRQSPAPGRVCAAAAISVLVCSVVAIVPSQTYAVTNYRIFSRYDVFSCQPSIGLFSCLISAIVLTVLCTTTALRQRRLRG